jgi:hypothetical protein
MTGEESGLLLRAWYRFVASDFWLDVLRSMPSPVVVRVPKARFILDAFYDPGPVDDLDDPPTVVFRGYLYDQPSTSVLEILRGHVADIGQLRGSNDGLGFLPDEYANYLKSKAAQLSKLSTDAYDVMLWRHGILDGPPSLTILPTSLFWAPIQSPRETFIADELDWHQVPAGIHLLELPPGQPLDLRPEVGDRLTELLDRQPQAPLGHVLFREAWRLRASNLRSALVMGVAAAEAAIKEFTRTAAPDTSWLLENMPSPPLDKLIRDYLPTLPSKARECETVPALPKEWRTGINKAVEARNRVVHGRLVALEPSEIERFLRIVRELLYFLDYQVGWDWAEGVSRP